MSDAPPIEVALSDDHLHLELRDRSGAATRLSAAMVDELIRTLARHRAEMRPVHPAEPPSDRDQTYCCDNLMWTVQPSPDRPAIDIGVQHPGIGWLILSLSRAQTEDLTASLAFCANEIQRFRMSSGH
jgi:hypothetical protein